MVKILRLTTQATDGSFETRFNAPVNIKPYSKLALQNLVMAVDKKEIVIDGTNDEMVFQVSSGNQRTIFLSRATYDGQTALSVFLPDIQKQLNGGLRLNAGKEIGAQFKVSFGSRITIQNAFSTISSYKNTFQSNNLLVAAGGTDKVISFASPSSVNYVSNISTDFNGGASRSDNQAIMFLDQPITKGVGVFRAKIHTLVNDAAGDAQTGFILGLSKRQPTSFFKDGVVANAFLDKDILFGVKVNRINQPIGIIREGNEVSSGTNLTAAHFVGVGNANNAIIEVSIQQNKMVATMYFNGGSVVLGTNLTNVDTSDLNIQTQDYFPVLIYRGAHNESKTTEHRFTQDPYATNPEVEESALLDHEHLGAPAPPKQTGGGQRKTAQFIQFTSVELAQRLGYSPNRNPRDGTIVVQKLVWTANLDFQLLALNDNFMVVVDSPVALEGYDSLIRGQRNLLSVIPVGDDTGIIRFSASPPVYIDANNQGGISLKNIRIRVLNADGSAVDSLGLSTATILIQE